MIINLSFYSIKSFILIISWERMMFCRFLSHHMKTKYKWSDISFFICVLTKVSFYYWFFWYIKFLMCVVYFFFTLISPFPLTNEPVFQNFWFLSIRRSRIVFHQVFRIPFIIKITSSLISYFFDQWSSSFSHHKS